MNTYAASYTNFPDTPKKHRLRTFIICIVLIMTASVYFLNRGNGSSPSPKESVSYIQTEPTLPPVSKATEVIRKETEYRVTTNPNTLDTYCKNYFEKDVYTYQYLGQTDASEPTLECS